MLDCTVRAYTFSRNIPEATEDRVLCYVLHKLLGYCYRVRYDVNDNIDIPTGGN